MALSQVNLISLTSDEQNMVAASSLSKEETATQTPRSALHSLASGGSTAQSPRSRCESWESGKSDEDSSKSDGGESCDGKQEAYDDFLRDYAGSFDAGTNSVDDDDDDDDDEGQDAVEIDRGDDAPDNGDLGRFSRKRSFACDLEEPAGVGEPETASGGTHAHKGDEETNDDDDDKQGVALKSVDEKGSETAGASASSAEPGRDAVADAAAGSLQDPGRSAERGQEGLVDHEGPVVDDYDVLAAVRHFAASRHGDAARQRREDVEEALRLKREQARRLGASARNALSPRHVRAQYVRVRDELVAQVYALEAWLASVDRLARERPAAATATATAAAAAAATARARAHGDEYGGQGAARAEASARGAAVATC
eukprot:CAMPEP_0203927746 /NCGR_PEP_ID=MMETSP0359-20131031/67130_1 /ASSEMBLY_ACC=CAM_ASM_000338 /TAXON_ID=268821 /ORGANISM="Scrippsiella Hangoei, Strain SHTV-5" /LENGTH=369 /DNA_ID=CAMNT_0050856567 /DNA_START=56 /DNA_END=1165 /DNA_ORIENTATION=+